MIRSRRYQGSRQRIQGGKQYSIMDGVQAVKSSATAKFDESVEVAVRLGIDPKKQDQLVSGTVALPHGTGRQVRVLVFCKGEKQDEARAAGADYVGFDDLIERISGGWAEFDVAVATPDTMSGVGRLGKVLGPKGLMPSPKTQTVTFDVGPAVRALKAGRIKFRTDKSGNVHALVGKVSFAPEMLVDNVRALVAELLRVRPATAKGQFLRGVVLSSTMGPGVPIDPSEFLDAAKKEG
uniref:Large ribosomal subunit protein uL1 n=1 Tax=candidate division WOR-3 bacterium TaxID=2052148 RepID=A0A7C4CCZ6_UNCW3